MRASWAFLGMGLALSTLVPSVARAGQCILMYSSSPNWEDPQNWGGACDGVTPDQRRVPKFDDDVLIGGSEFLAILSSDVSVKSLTVAGGGLSIAPGGHLTVSDGGAVTGSGLGVDGGLFDINGTFVLSMSSYALGVSKNGVVNVNSGRRSTSASAVLTRHRRSPTSRPAASCTTTGRSPPTMPGVAW